jgi:hypothetical protein
MREIVLLSDSFLSQPKNVGRDVPVVDQNKDIQCGKILETPERPVAGVGVSIIHVG